MAGQPEQRPAPSQEPSADRLGQVLSGSVVLRAPADLGGADSAPAPALQAPTDISAAAGAGEARPSVSDAREEGVASAGLPPPVRGGVLLRRRNEGADAVPAGPRITCCLAPGGRSP